MNKKALVIGDIILDEYIEGNYAKRTSDDGKQIFLKEAVTYIAGGAGNVASNIVQAGIPTAIIGVIGLDKDSQCCRNILNQNGLDTSMIVVEQQWQIPVKTRYMIQNQQVFRSDKIRTATIEKSTEYVIMSHLRKHIQEFSSIVIADYQTGVLTKDLIPQIIQLASQYNRRIISDSKAHCLLPFKGSYLIKMNHEELGTVTKRICDSLDKIKKSALQIIKQCQCNYLLVTWGKKGMVLLTNSSSIQCIRKHSKFSAICTIGAGDIITAYLLAGIENNLPIGQSMALANQAAEIAVSMPLTTVLRIPLLDLKYSSLSNELAVLEEIKRNGGIENDKNSAWSQYWT